MEHLNPTELLRFLEREAETLTKLQLKISVELHQLQVEEEVFVRTIDRLKGNATSASSREGVAEERKKKKKKNWEDAGANKGGLELVEALQIELARVPPLQMHEPEPLVSAPAPSKGKSKGKAKVELQAETETPASLLGIEDEEDEDDEYKLLDKLESGDGVE